MTDIESDLLIANAEIKMLRRRLEEMTAELDKLRAENGNLFSRAIKAESEAETLWRTIRQADAAIKSPEQKRKCWGRAW